MRERELAPDAVEDIIIWCTTFPDILDSVCRIGPVVSRFASGAQEKPLIEAALLVLEHGSGDWLTDKGVRDATVATIGALARKSRFTSDFKSRLDHIHIKVLLNPAAYQAALVPGTPNFVLNPSLVQHVADMLERAIIDQVSHADALERFADWLTAWPSERKHLLAQPIQMLKRNCPRPGLWDRVGMPSPD